MKKYLSLYFCYFFAQNISFFAQNIPYSLNNTNVYHMLDRLDILYNSNKGIHTIQKPYNSQAIVQHVIQLDTTIFNLSSKDKLDIQYIINDNNEWISSSELPNTLIDKKLVIDSTTLKSQLSAYYVRNKKPLLKHFYRTPPNFWELNTKYFDLKINPIIDFELANDRYDNELIFLNQRGIEIKGNVDDRVYFYSQILETQQRFPNYINAWIIQNGNTIPSNGWYKYYNSLVFKSDKAYDFLNAQGILGFNATSHIGVQFGHGRNFLGDGIRSLFLSDFANNYFYLKFNTKVWKFSYQNIFAELVVDNYFSDKIVFPKKYMALHQLSYNIHSSLNVGIFEGVIIAREKGFELQYLNPIILYQSVNHSLGSPDNTIVGSNFKWNFLKKISFYGQLLLDEFNFQELIDHPDWWGNKYGIQLGLKYINMFNIDHLDGQIEYNKVRPFTYSHIDSTENYTHYLQPLAHPLGANFKEFIGKIVYQPLPKLRLNAGMMYALVGESSATQNWGDRPIIPYTTRIGDYGYFTGEGVKGKIFQVSFDASYEFYHKMFLDLHILARKKDSDDVTRNERTFYFGSGFRMNIGYNPPIL